MKTIFAITAIVGASMGAPLFTDHEVLSHNGDRESWIPSGSKCGSPALVDWNNDGVKDLVVGYLKTPSGAGMTLALNSGTNDSPIYEAPVSVTGYNITGV